ncbi:prenyltransferase/squalene oxidase repeat-containing protein [Botrimarina sp.]|uniref:prenyltransferase/squalene oxidase repeat-containing protein n=1 Tax=Botrimarina sp. TaxID=2795802 RepID=UPI0032F02108
MPTLSPTHPPADTPSDAARADPPGRAASDRLPSALGWWLEDAPAWLASALLHLALLILVALFAYGAASDPPISLTAGIAEDAGEDDLDEPLDLAAAELDLDTPELAADAPPLPLDPIPVPEVTPSEAVGPVAVPLPPSVTPGAALSGRDPASQDALLKQLGGTAATQSAVEEGLRWLARRQLPDGGWSLIGPYADGGVVENREAATAMALVAFQGAGKLPSPRREDFGRNVLKGWRYLLAQQQPDGSFFRHGASNHRFYTDALCTIAVCELLAMTGDQQYRQPATDAINHLIRSQGKAGGWKYNAASRSDLSVTGWVLMALKSGRLAGIEVPSPVFTRIEEFLDEVGRSDTPAGSPDDSRYVYEPSSQFIREAVPTMTATGLLCREYLGWPGEKPEIDKGLDFIAYEHPPEWRRGKVDVYYWYYATQACLHAGGRQWPVWNRVMRELLPKHQEQQGPERGSWDPSLDAWGTSGGRLYMTALSIYTLEVYYRHLPLYQQRAVR